MQHGSRTQLTQFPNKLAPAIPGQKILVKAQVHGPPGMQKVTNPTYGRKFEMNSGVNIMSARGPLPAQPASNLSTSYAGVGAPYQSMVTSTPLRAGVPKVGNVSRMDTIQSMSSRGLDPSSASAYTSLAKQSNLSASTGAPTASRGMTTAGMQTERSMATAGMQTEA